VVPPEKQGRSVTISLGAALACTDDAARVRSAMARADEALYQAKNSGHNCVKVESSPWILTRMARST